MQSDIVERLDALIEQQRIARGDMLYYGKPDQALVDARAEITRLTEALRAAEEREKALREVLVVTEGAIAEYYRYWTGGETRGSYDGKPERAGLWKAQQIARQAIAAALKEQPHADA